MHLLGYYKILNPKHIIIINSIFTKLEWPLQMVLSHKKRYLIVNQVIFYLLF